MSMKIFTVESVTFSLEAEPSSFPDVIIQMALNKNFFPLLMLMTFPLNCIETNQIVKYKHVTYGAGAGKYFLDKTCFTSEDECNNFELIQAYTNWLTLIEVVSEPIVEQGWHVNHKH